jgi:adenylate kinase
MRWYDIEPDVCMAISMIECAEKKAQVQYAEYIIKLVKEKDTEMSYIKNTTINNMEKKYQRWYDKNETISTAFSYLKGTTKTIQKEVSLSVLALMKSAVA